MGCLVVAEFLLTSASRSPSAVAEPLVGQIEPWLQTALYNISTINWPNGVRALSFKTL